GIVGLDIGSSYIKAVQLNETRSGYELALFDSLPISPELIVEGSIIDAIRVTESLRELVRKARIKANDAVIAISGHSSVIIKRISLPEMSEEELGESIKFEAEQYVPFDIEDVNLDFQILGPKEEPGQMDVILVAVKKEVINDYVSVVKEAGLNTVIVDVDAFALENMYGINYEVEAGRNVALVNIGASTINMNILKGGVSVFTRDSSVGSNIHTDALQKEFGISFEEAERLKRGEPVEKVKPEDAYSLITNASSDIFGEVARSVDYFRSSTLQSEVKEVILSGGCALIRGFPGELSDKIGIPVRVAEPFRNVTIPKKFDSVYIEETAPIAAIAVGLATRRPGDR
ncbi:MAG TPA: type IV pilus assembly protein PilM, partial [Thermodesulfovibrionales bacterium]|nr:type IV pilus assembly protein PilM [Thermodesulfovibrionales bacterium]